MSTICADEVEMKPLTKKADDAGKNGAAADGVTVVIVTGMDKQDQ